MNDNRDPVLAELFAQSVTAVTDELFTSSVMRKIRFRQMLLLAFAGVVAVIFLTIATAYSVPLQQVVLPFTEALGTQLVEVEDSTVSWIIAPVNNLATLFIVFAKLARMLWLRIRRSNYAI